MPAETEVKSSWADDFEDDNDDISSIPIETIKDNIKTVVEHRLNSEGKKVKVTRQYRIEKRKVSKSIAVRKTWKKFGNSSNDGPGPQSATTLITEEISMQFITSREDAERTDNDEPLNKLKSSKQSTVRCRVCKSDHWTHNCPHKDALAPNKDVEEKKTPAVDEKNMRGLADANKKYVPPIRREGATSKGESMMSQKDDQPTIRISNLSESTKEADLQDLCKPLGRTSRIYLGKNKQTGESRGFAYVTFYCKEDAAKAIHALNGFGYDHLILKVEWSTTSKK